MIPGLPPWAQDAITIGLHLLGILVLAYILVRLLRVLTKRLIRPAADTSRTAVRHEQQTRTLAELLYSAGTAIIISLALLSALAELRFNITPIAAVAGLASLALGFGGQYLVRDIINGFFIIFEDQFEVGDTVRIGGQAGRIEHLTLRRTVIRDPQGALVTIPNGEIRTLANLSRDWSQMSVDVTLSIESDVTRALSVMEEVAAEMRSDEKWSAALVDGPRVLGVETLAAETITLRVQVRTAPNRQHDVARELRRRMRARFEQEQIGISTAPKVVAGDGDKSQ
ncbi:MAG TPA: mechanosensitive ion channel domain-containing protein [Candidatus Acidoferrales bacterium]|jgi:small conductance mechanosensitive channel|nr:mechanosensitive ion channel domain-containing protein [Candidatus Acidoferrales bacterium]